MNAWVTCGGSFATVTGLSTLAPLRAIGVPSAASRVISGGAIGWSDFDSGAVIASHSTIRTNKLNTPAMMRRVHHQRPCFDLGVPESGCPAAVSGGLVVPR